MLTNYEIAHGKVIPKFRKAVAMEMSKTYKLSQQQIANHLGITQAAVSKYLSSRKAMGIKDKHVKEFIEAVLRGNRKESNGVICKACQATRSFDCAFMFKQ